MARVFPKKNCSIRRRESRSFHGENGDKLKTGSRTVDIIEVIAVNDDPESLVLSLKTVTERFKEGVILFNNGKIEIYIDKHGDFRTCIENISDYYKKSFSELHDVYANNKHFITYQEEMDNLKVLPKNLYCSSIFKKLKENVCINGSRTIVKLQDLISQEQKKKTIDFCEDCAKKQLLGPMYRKCHYSHHKNNFKTQVDSKCNISLIHSKKKRFHSITKVPVSYQPLSRFSLTKQRHKTYESVVGPSSNDRFHLPEHVQDDRFFDPSLSQQVISTDNSTSFNRDIAYGIGQESGVNHYRNNFNAVATNNSLLTVGESHNVTQRQSVTPPPKYPRYVNYAERLMSYARWIARRPEPTTLSHAGFFFTNDGDLVRCFQCGIGLKDFSEDDDPMLEHVRHSKLCSYLPEVLGEVGLANYRTRLQAIDPEYNRQQQWAQRQNGSVPRKDIRHPEYKTIEARLRSFTNWPQNMIQTPQQLAEAGLYYTGFEDQVRCFACDGGLRRWDPEDDPWTEHCRWFPACQFASEQKGEHFIALVQASVEDQTNGASGGGEQDISPAMELLRLKESAFEAVLGQHRTICLEMGYEEDLLKEAIHELLDRGQEKPTLEEIIVLIDVIRERKELERQASMIESPMEENRRLKSIVYCMICRKNTVNALFLPCTHHELCMTCADPVDKCPVCQRKIREKIHTYMA